MHSTATATVCIASLGLLLSGCLGGGGGAAPTATATPVVVSPPPPAPPSGSPFSSWAAATFPGAYRLVGAGATLGQANLYTMNRGAWLPGTPGWEDEGIYLKFDSAGALTDAAIVEEENFWRWTANANSTLSSITLGFGSGSLTMKQLASGDNNTGPMGLFTYADPASTTLSYQTFGWWLKPQGEIVGERWGSFSVGAPTPPQSIPSSGTAQFSGALGATGIDTGFGDIAAPVAINVDFGSRRAAFNSANFRDAQGTVYAGTALTGTLTYGSQQNALNGPLTSTAYAGPANGRFYGPTAEEIGGSFVLFPTDPNANGRVVGGFGAKR